MPTVLLHYCAGKGLDEEAGRRGKGLRFPEEPSAGQSQSPGWFPSAEARPGERENWSWGTSFLGPAPCRVLMTVFSCPP